MVGVIAFIVDAAKSNKLIIALLSIRVLEIFSHATCTRFIAPSIPSRYFAACAAVAPVERIDISWNSSTWS